MIISFPVRLYAKARQLLSKGGSLCLCLIVRHVLVWRLNLSSKFSYRLMAPTA